jgi:hypothetical protein
MAKNIKQRKVPFYTLIQREWGTKNEAPYVIIEDVVKYINSLGKKAKIYSLKESKICLLQSAHIENEKNKPVIIKGFFKSARHSFRPNLINTDTGDERTSPKLLKEGDIEKTHFIIKITSSDVFLLVESNGNGVTVGQIVNYFGFYARKYLILKKKKRNFSIVYTKVVVDDFLKVIRTLKRTRVAEIYFDKSFLGSSGLKYSDRTTPLKRDLMLTAKAEKDESITETAIDIFNKINDAGSGISKVRIYGNDKNNSPVMLDTSFIEKAEYLKVDINPTTGEVNTTEMLTGLQGLLNNYK